MTKELKYLVLSDLHLGHAKNKSRDIIFNLNIFFDDYTPKSQFTDLDIIFIAGDLFDGLLDLSSSDIHEASLWLSRLMNFCARFNIKLRILEGTPSHDWRQSKIAETIACIIKLPLDFKYINTLHIEYLEDLQSYILYMPDEWTANAELSFSQVQTLLHEMQISQVDIAIMHGLFNYQLKHIVGNIQKHNEYDYLGIVKHFINIGHIHTFSTYERIIAQGSFDRLCHGEEEPKGAVLCTISDKEDSFSFIENKHAKIFKTIELKSNDLEVSFKKIDRVISKLPDNSHVRIKAKKDNPIYTNLDELKLKYPMIYFSKVSIEDIEEEYHLINTSADLSKEYSPIAITSENVRELLLTEINNKYKLTDKQLVLFDNILAESI